MAKKEILGKLRERLQAAINNADLSEFGDLDVSIGNISYTGSTIFPVTVKIEVARKGEDGAVESRIAESFKQNASLFGLEPEDLGRTFVHNAETYRIVGLKTRNPKYPIIAEKDGRQFKYPEDLVKQLLQASRLEQRMDERATEHAEPICGGVGEGIELPSGRRREALRNGRRG